MHRYVDTLNRLVRAGYNRDKAMLAVARAYALTPEQIADLNWATRRAARWSPTLHHAHNNEV
jgi:hypothetical protein